MALSRDHSNNKDVDDLPRRLTEIVLSDDWSLAVLRNVRALSLPDWAIGAGFVRSLVWDKLTNAKIRTPLADIDVLYFDSDDCSVETEQRYLSLLNQLRPGIPWSAKNQARMHLRNTDDPYTDTNDALRFWLETVTCIAVRLEDNDALTIMAPYGLRDLFAMSVHPTPSGLQKLDQYRLRVEDKNWPHFWPTVRIAGL
jgi:hypothetical protein